jgi:hypothetical protein
MGAEAIVVFTAVVGARFLVPLLIPRFPLPAIVAALVLDGMDQTIFQWFGYDPPGYQGYDKAMDVYYLAIAYLTTLRNWTSRPAVDIARFLYFYRLVGVVAFELTEWRPLLLIFPNTFEYFFIAYEIVRLRRDPTRYQWRFWLYTAAAIWIFVKLPQEYWIHIAQLDVTDTIAEWPWASFAVACLAAGLGVAAWFWVRPRLDAADWPWRFRADPLPVEMDTVAERNQWVAAHGRLLSVDTAEKVFLVGFLVVIFAQVLPELRSTNLELFIGSAILVTVNAAVSLWVARGARGVDSKLVAFGARVIMNVGLVLLADWLLRRENGDLNQVAALFFVLLLSLLTLLDDRYRPVHDFRFATAQPAAQPPGAGPQQTGPPASSPPDAIPTARAPDDRPRPGGAPE